ncbi:MAG: hypothetical protein WCH34_09275 [Bacteroidota bacterium]
MTNREQARDTMYTALYEELTADSDAYDGDDDFMAEAADYMEDYVAYKNALAEAFVDNSGFSAEKLTAKTDLASFASNLSGKAYVRFNKLGKPSLADQLHTEPTDFNAVADAQCGTNAKADHDLMLANLPLLTPTNTVTAANLTTLLGKINLFKSIQGSSETVHEASPLLTKAFRKSAKVLKNRVANFKFLGRDYEESKPAFFRRLKASMVVPTVNVHHTYLEINATAKSSGNPMANVIFTLTKSKKSATTDGEGNATIEEVKAGKDVLTGTVNGAVVVTLNVSIKRGTTNHIQVVIG